MIDWSCRTVSIIHGAHSPQLLPPLAVRPTHIFVAKYDGKRGWFENSQKLMMHHGDGARNWTSSVQCGVISIWYRTVQLSGQPLPPHYSSSSQTAFVPHNHFYLHSPFLLAMNVFFWTLALFFVASTSHAIRVPISRFKLHNSSPLERRAQGHGGVSYNVLATGESPEDLKLVGYPCRSAHILIWLRNKQRRRFDLHG